MRWARCRGANCGPCSREALHERRGARHHLAANGGTDDTFRNLIAKNGQYGIKIDGSGNTIDFNWIGYDTDQFLAANGLGGKWDAGFGNIWGPNNLIQ